MEFGSYKTVRELAASPAAAVYLASAGGGDGRFAIKVCAAGAQPFGAGPDASMDAWQTDVAGAGIPGSHSAEQASAFLAATSKQKRAGSAGARHVAPVHDGGQSDSGPWFATDYYPRSVQKLIEGRVALPVEALYHIVCSVVRGAIEYKANAGEAHGNIKPSNALIAHNKTLTSAQVLLSDPAPPGRTDAGRVELADLRAIGELIYQLVRRREVSGAQHWPIETGPEWRTIFGDAAPEWLKLCNQLLDPNLSLSVLTLEGLQAALVKLKPRDSTAVFKLGGIGAGVVVLGLLIWAFIPRQHWIEIVTTPAGAAITDNTGKSLGVTPLKIAAAPGRTLSLKLSLEDYDEVLTNMVVRRSAVAFLTKKSRIDVALRERNVGDEVFFAIREFKRAVGEVQQRVNQMNYLGARSAIAEAEKRYPSDAGTRSQCAEPRKRLDGLSKTVGETLQTQLSAALANAKQALARRDFKSAATNAQSALAIEKDVPDAKAILDQVQQQLSAQQQYEVLMQAARAALAGGDFADAIEKASDALKKTPNDKAAGGILAEAQTEMAYRAALGEASRALDNKDYKTAIAKANEALAKRDLPEPKRIAQQAQVGVDFETNIGQGKQALATNGFVAAIASFKKAIELRKDSVEANQLLADAHLKSGQEKLFNEALQAAAAAAGTANYPEVVRNAKRALEIKSDSPQATSLLQSATAELEYRSELDAANAGMTQNNFSVAVARSQRAIELAAKLNKDSAEPKAILAKAERELSYASSVAEARTALDRGDYQTAMAKAREALEKKPGDAAAESIRSGAETEVSYRGAVSDARAAFAKKDYAGARDGANKALQIKRAGKEASDILAQASTELDYDSAATLLKQSNYAAVEELCAKHAGVEKFKALAEQSVAEKNAYTSYRAAFDKADYSFIDRVQADPWKDKEGFQSLLAQARTEKQMLEQLLKWKQETNWFELSKAVQQLPAKQTFTDIANWYLTKNPTALLDNRVKLLQVWLGANKPSPLILDPETKQPATKLATGADVTVLRNVIVNLRTRYKAANLLTADRAAALLDLERRIDRWN